MDELVKVSDNTILKINVGKKNKGKKIANVPAVDLLEWYYSNSGRNGSFKKGLRKYIEENIEILEIEASKA